MGTKTKSRKFVVVIMVTVIFIMAMIIGAVAAWKEIDVPWLAVTLPILASVYPAYLGANAYQKKFRPPIIDNGGLTE